MLRCSLGFRTVLDRVPRKDFQSLRNIFGPKCHELSCAICVLFCFGCIQNLLGQVSSPPPSLPPSLTSPFVARRPDAIPKGEVDIRATTQEREGSKYKLRGQVRLETA